MLWPVILRGCLWFLSRPLLSITSTLRSLLLASLAPMAANYYLHAASVTAVSFFMKGSRCRTSCSHQGNFHPRGPQPNLENKCDARPAGSARIGQHRFDAAKVLAAGGALPHCLPLFKILEIWMGPAASGALRFGCFSKKNSVSPAFKSLELTRIGTQATTRWESSGGGTKLTSSA